MKKVIFILVLVISTNIYAQKQFFGNFTGSNSQAKVQENSKIAYYNTYDKIGEVIKVPFVYDKKKTINLTLDSIQCYYTNKITFFKKDNELINEGVHALTYYFSSGNKTYKYRISVLNGYADKKYSLFFDENNSEIVIRCIGKDVKDEPIAFVEI